MGDLRKYENSREAFRAAYSQHYPGEPRAAVRMRAGELFRFVQRMECGDIIIYPLSDGGVVRVGEVKTDYRHRPKANRHFPHVRKVKWISATPWKHLPPRVKATLSGPTALYKPRQNVDALCKSMLH